MATSSNSAGELHSISITTGGDSDVSMTAQEQLPVNLLAPETAGSSQQMMVRDQVNIPMELSYNVGTLVTGILNLCTSLRFSCGNFIHPLLVLVRS